MELGIYYYDNVDNKFINIQDKTVPFIMNPSGDATARIMVKNNSRNILTNISITGPAISGISSYHLITNGFAVSADINVAGHSMTVARLGPEEFVIFYVKFVTTDYFSFTDTIPFDFEYTYTSSVLDEPEIIVAAAFQEVGGAFTGTGSFILDNGNTIEVSA